MYTTYIFLWRWCVRFENVRIFLPINPHSWEENQHPNHTRSLCEQCQGVECRFWEANIIPSLPFDWKISGKQKKRKIGNPDKYLHCASPPAHSDVGSLSVIPKIHENWENTKMRRRGGNPVDSCEIVRSLFSKKQLIKNHTPGWCGGRPGVAAAGRIAAGWPARWPQGSVPGEGGLA